MPTVATHTHSLRTLPELAAEWRASLDLLREMLREDADLRTLGTRIGGTRAFTAADAEAIRTAYERRRAGARAR